MKNEFRFLRMAVIIALLCTAFSAAAQTESEVLATNSWTAAFAAAAGVENTRQLAPGNMAHPPEYELRPSDVQKIHSADLLVFAGYEVLMRTVLNSFDLPEANLIKIKTAYSPAIIRESVTAIARRAGTLEAAEVNLGRIDHFFDSMTGPDGQLAEAGINGARVIVHFHQQAFIRALGFDVVAVFGPAPIEAKQLAELGNLDYELIIDNGHNPIASGVAEISGKKRIELINFPGHPSQTGRDNTSLMSILRHNAGLLTE